MSDSMFWIELPDGTARRATLQEYLIYELNPMARVVEKTMLTPEIEVSTVFLGLDHSHTDDGLPILYETMVFGGPLDGEQGRYETRAQAKAGHAEWVRKVRDALTEEV